ncbi:MAG TPA: peptidoglycan DD-metalloendopeptidase family protein [Vicinamibacteria bacterium]|nr:peptidoglycan DD-metalloendopeptidase family protein [Vicinamibacteria bacterium]
MLPPLVLVAALVYPAPTGDPANVEARRAEEEKKLETLGRRLDELRQELDGLDERESSLLGELYRIDIEIQVATDEIERLGILLQRSHREVDEILKRIQALETSIAELKPFLVRRSRSLYKLGRLSYTRLLLSVERPSELTRAYRYISRLAREDSTKMRQFVDDQRALEVTKAELLQKTQQALTTREEREKTTRTLEHRRASREALLEVVNERQEMAGTLVLELEQARSELSKLVESLGEGQAVDETVHLPLAAFEGSVGWPVQGALSGRFGRQVHPRFLTVTVRNGIEIDAPSGASVHAVYEGEVVFASWFQGYGRLLIVRHPGGAHSLYGYLNELLAEQGDWVSTGEAIATVGDTGSLSGPSLYFELRIDGKPVNPEGWLDSDRRLASN